MGEPAWKSVARMPDELGERAAVNPHPVVREVVVGDHDVARISNDPDRGPPAEDEAIALVRLHNSRDRGVGPPRKEVVDPELRHRSVQQGKVDLSPVPLAQADEIAEEESDPGIAGARKRRKEDVAAA